MDTVDGWEVFDAALPLIGTRYGRQGVRTTAVGLGDGKMLVYSPGAPLDDARFAALSRWGTPTVLLAPNHFHNAGLAPWHARFPAAELVAHPRAHKRLAKQTGGLVFTDVTALQGRLSPHVKLLVPPDCAQGETWLSVRTSAGTAWLVCDAILNEVTLGGGLLRPLMWLLGFRTGLSLSRFFMRMFAERPVFLAWLKEALDQDPPQLLVPAHGVPILSDELASRLREIR